MRSDQERIKANFFANLERGQTRLIARSYEDTVRMSLAEIAAMIKRSKLKRLKPSDVDA